KDGSRVDVSLTVSPIRDATGNVTGASAVARDITDRRRAEEARRAQALELNDDVVQGLVAAQYAFELGRAEEAERSVRATLAAARRHGFAPDFFHAGTYVFIGGAGVSLLAALTGYWDWLKSSEKGTQARRTINTHAWIMITVTVLAIVDIAIRLSTYHTRGYPNIATLILSLAVAGLVSIGATYGGS